MKLRSLFQVVSYLGYPFMFLGLYFAMQPYLHDFNIDYSDLNNSLVCIGLGISFLTLQDTTKTQNKMSKRIWESRIKGRVFLIFLAFLTLFFIGMGTFGYFMSENVKLKEVSFGIIVVGIGMIGMLKSAMEMYEYHSNRVNSR